MKKIRFIIVVVFLLKFTASFSINVPGYVIRNNSDTIFGEIEVSRFEIYTGGILFYDINTEPLHSEVFFREYKTKRFKFLMPSDISGFGFIYKSEHYNFKTFEIESKSIIKSERKKLRFLNLIYKGDIAVYKDFVRKENVYMPNFQNKFIDYYVLYLYDNKHGLKKAIWSEEFKSITDLLHYYEIDTAFLAQLSDKVRFKDITQILYEYELWKFFKSDYWKSLKNG